MRMCQIPSRLWCNVDSKSFFCCSKGITHSRLKPATALRNISMRHYRLSARVVSIGIQTYSCNEICPSSRPIIRIQSRLEIHQHTTTALRHHYNYKKRSCEQFTPNLSLKPRAIPKISRFTQASMHASYTAHITALKQYFLKHTLAKFHTSRIVAYYSRIQANRAQRLLVIHPFIHTRQ